MTSGATRSQFPKEQINELFSRTGNRCFSVCVVIHWNQRGQPGIRLTLHIYLLQDLAIANSHGARTLRMKNGHHSITEEVGTGMAEKGIDDNLHPDRSQRYNVYSPDAIQPLPLSYHPSPLRFPQAVLWAYPHDNSGSMKGTIVNAARICPSGSPALSLT